MKKHVKHIKKIKKTTQTHKIPALLFVVIFAGLGAFILTLTHAASSATISLTPSTSTVSLGSNVTVTVVVNSGTNLVNTVEADLKFDPAKLQFLSADSTIGIDNPTSGMGFDQPIEKKVYATDLTLLRITNGDTTPGSGTQTLATATFKTLAAGPASITIDPASHVFLHNAPAGTSPELFTTTGSTGTNITVNDTTPPSPPTSLAATGTTVKATNLSWTASTDDTAVTGYDIFQGSTQIGTSLTNSYPVSGLNPSTAYAFKVRAHDAVPNNSGFSNIVNVTTLADTTAPSAPTNPQITTQATSATLTWTASTDDVTVGGYDIFQSNGTTKISTTTNNTYTVTGLTPGTPYVFKVQAFDTASPTPNRSAQVSFSGTTISDTQAPSKPGLNNTPAKTNTTVTLSWTASTDNIAVTRYDILDGTTVVGTTTGLSNTVTNLTPGSTHSFTVKAYDAAQNNTQSDPVSVTLGIKSGDITLDNNVDGSDFQIAAFNWRKDPATRAQGNLSAPADTVVDSLDLSILFSGWGK
jgi:hypothetical protein